MSCSVELVMCPCGGFQDSSLLRGFSTVSWHQFIFLINQDSCTLWSEDAWNLHVYQQSLKSNEVPENSIIMKDLLYQRQITYIEHLSNLCTARICIILHEAKKSLLDALSLLSGFASCCKLFSPILAVWLSSYASLAFLCLSHSSSVGSKLDCPGCWESFPLATLFSLLTGLSEPKLDCRGFELSLGWAAPNATFLVKRFLQKKRNRYAGILNLESQRSRIEVSYLTAALYNIKCLSNVL